MDVNHSGSTVLRSYNCAQKNDPRHVKVVGWLADRKCPCPSDNVYRSLMSPCFLNLIVQFLLSFSQQFFDWKIRGEVIVFCVY